MSKAPKDDVENGMFYLSTGLTDEQFNDMFNELKVWLKEFYNYAFPEQYMKECEAGEGDMRHIVQAAATFYKKGLNAASVIVAS